MTWNKDRSLKQKRVAYLVMKNAGDYVTDFHLSVEPMEALGWAVEEVAWRDAICWDDFDAVYVCTPWDYPEHTEQFLAVLQAIDRSRAVLINDIATIRWNLDKTYLRDIAAQGADIVPSIWRENFVSADVDEYFALHNADALVIKPTVGANAMDTYVLRRPLADSLLFELTRLFAQRAFIVQPFVKTIQSEGEFSLFFFNGEYSHAIQKVPKSGDFRVQEEHGAEIVSVQPEGDLKATATAVFAQLDPVPVYGRGDWVRGDDGRYWLMELELIEPSLYLRTDSGAAARFARAFDQRFQELTRK